MAGSPRGGAVAINRTDNWDSWSCEMMVVFRTDGASGPFVDASLRLAEDLRWIGNACYLLLPSWQDHFWGGPRPRPGECELGSGSGFPWAVRLITHHPTTTAHVTIHIPIMRRRLRCTYSRARSMCNRLPFTRNRRQPPHNTTIRPHRHRRRRMLHRHPLRHVLPGHPKTTTPDRTPSAHIMCVGRSARRLWIYRPIMR